RAIDADSSVLWLPSLRRRHDDWEVLTESLRQMELHGRTVDWRGFAGDYDLRPCDAPTYPFNTRRFWRGARAIPAPGDERGGRTGGGPAEEPRRQRAGLYEVAWVADGEHRPEAAAAPAEEWLILGRTDDLRAAWDPLLDSRGVRRSWSGAPSESTAKVVFCAAPASAVAESGGAGLAVGEAQTEELLRLIRALPAEQGPELWILSRESVPLEQRPLRHLSGLMLTAIGQVFALERPGRWGGMIDLDSGDEDELVICTDLLLGAQPAEKWLALRAGRRYVPRLRRAPPPEAGRTVEVRRRGSYLITGGMGAIGMRLAAWLVERGAGRIVLIGRRPPGPEVTSAVERWKGEGTEVETIRCDVASYDDLVRHWPAIAGGPLPLRGTFHAAGVVMPLPLSELDPEDLAALTRAKTFGALYLHQLTQDLELDFFALFSSIASVWGTRALAAYAAGNRFLDGLAHLRRGRQLPAISLNWGPWKNGGMVDEAREQDLRRLGVHALEPADALACLAPLLAREQPQLVVADLDWKPFLAVMEAVGQQRWLLDAAPASARAATPGRTGPGPLLASWRAVTGAERHQRIVADVSNLVGSIMGLPASEPPEPERGFFDMGFDSLMAVQLRNRLQQGTGLELPATLTFNHTNIHQLAAYLAQRLDPDPAVSPAAPVSASPVTEIVDDAIAIVAMGCRFPGGAVDPERYWELLASRRHAVTDMPVERRRLVGAPEIASQPIHGAYLPGVELFDARFFGISAREARAMDPQQRLLLEVAWEALDNAGWSRASPLGSRVGVFMGLTTTDYGYLMRARGMDEESLPYLASGNTLNAAAGRISYVFGFQGPAMGIDTACSSSLVAVHSGCLSLRAGECDLALAGGVNLIVDPQVTASLTEARMLSADGLLRAFDDRADGYVRGEGCGVLVLKRRRDALRDGDRILALIAASAVNQDGAGSGFTVPNGESQRAVIATALARSGLRGDQIDYVEAHGTGTPLGDPIEIEALADTLGPDRPADRPLLVGSVKTNLGHSESAAGIAGLIKVVLALHHDTIPAQLHFEQPNTHIDWQRIPIEVVDRARPWPRQRGPRAAGVNSFGMSGTNVHLIVTDVPETEARAVSVGRTRDRDSGNGPVDRQRFWALPEGDAAAAPEAAGVAGWFYAVRWREQPRAPAESAPTIGRWLLFLEPGALHEGLVGGMRERGHEVMVVHRGPSFRAVDRETCEA
ncbi:MAG: KR domain-containing protein, partial [bacterium]|nr:KR domain-containing protein [bacterium]